MNNNFKKMQKKAEKYANRDIRGYFITQDTKVRKEEKKVENCRNLFEVQIRI